MIKETTVRTVAIIPRIYYVCDVCGAELNYGLAYGRARCRYCGKDLCEKCIEHEEETGTDRRDVWCQRCWDLGAEYRPKIESLNRAGEALNDEWREKCSIVEGKYKLGCKHHQIKRKPN